MNKLNRLNIEISLEDADHIVIGLWLNTELSGGVRHLMITLEDYAMLLL